MSKIEWTRAKLRCSRGYKLRSSCDGYSIVVAPEVFGGAHLSILGSQHIEESDDSAEAVERLKALAQRIEDAIHEHRQHVIKRMDTEAA